VLAQVHVGFAAESSKRMRKYDRTNHPGLTPEANRKRSEARKRQRAEELAWEREHPGAVDREQFRRDVAPRLADLSARAIARVTGLSVSYCAKVKKGERVPHQMWWGTLSALAVEPRLATGSKKGQVSDRSVLVRRSPVRMVP
jgi:hypothetical protein